MNRPCKTFVSIAGFKKHCRLPAVFLFQPRTSSRQPAMFLMPFSFSYPFPIPKGEGKRHIPWKHGSTYLKN